ncbi:hypothetical protein DK846_12655 [Methanospirillum lacunae]|uniref:DUF3821 domain-containing protein n=1 Tax=Methanospirillum lacunae TaxID=668570 RepID=A0A2V2MWC2_9EURY|nr:hypothetical protein DK846_12655 [Methanospirillum lacunae]
MISPAFAGTGVTISADGNQSYYLGEKVVLRGQNTDSNTTYLFLTGPNRQDKGVKLTSPDNAVVSGNPDSFTEVKTKPDKTWEYSIYTANLPFDAGSYSIYAESQPNAKDQLGPEASQINLIIKKPYIMADISPLSVNGQLFTVNGTAIGIPPAVQIWILGDNYVFNTTIPVNPDASFTFNADATVSEKIPKGQNYLIVQHPMADNQFDLVISGDYVHNLKLNNSTILFKLIGPGSLQGSNAANALISAFHDGMANDPTLIDDTFAIIPFTVGDLRR